LSICPQTLAAVEIMYYSRDLISGYKYSLHLPENDGKI